MYQGNGGSVWQASRTPVSSTRVEPGRDPGVHVGDLVGRHVPVGGEPADARDDDRVGVLGEQLAHRAGDVDDALELLGRALPVRVVLAGEVEDEVAGEEVGGVARVPRRQPTGQGRAGVDLEVLVGEVELEEVRGAVGGEGRDVVVAHRQPPRAPERVLPPGGHGVGEVGGVEEVAGEHRPVGAAPEEAVEGVGLEAAAGALDVDRRRGRRARRRRGRGPRRGSWPG